MGIMVQFSIFFVQWIFVSCCVRTHLPDEFIGLLDVYPLELLLFSTLLEYYDF
jgi:hypothetical protein